MESYKPWIDDGRPITVRQARPGDGAGLRTLATLDSARPLEGDVLVAEVDGELRAAVSLADGRMIADPFRATRLARDLLALRLRALETSASRPGRRRLQLRASRFV